MRFINELVIIIGLAELALGGVAKREGRANLDEINFATAGGEQQSHILNKLSKIGRARRLPAPTPMPWQKPTLHPGQEEVEFMYLDPEWNRAPLQQTDDAETRRKEAEENLIANKEKIKLSRGFQQINSIYKSLRRGDRIYGNSNINTIRFIPAIKVETDQKQSFVFNLSMLSLSESILKCELYISKKHIKQRIVFDLRYLLQSRVDNQSQNVTSHQLSTQIDLGNLRIDRHSLIRTNNWHQFNLVDSLRPYVETRRTKTINASPADLVLIMESNRAASRRTTRSYNVDLANPYLMVYSKEQDTQMKQFFQNRIPRELESINKVSSLHNSNSDMYLDESSRLKKEETPKKTFDSAVTGDSLPKTLIYPSRHDKSIILVEELQHAPQLVSITPLTSASEAAMTTKRARNASLSSIFYLPKLRRRLKRRRRNLLPSLDDEDDMDGPMLSMNESEYTLTAQHLDSTDAVDATDACRLSPVDIDFDDIGFTSWILEPRRFSTAYCAGKCLSLPSSRQRTTYTNYATLQSISKAFDFFATAISSSSGTGSSNNQRAPLPELCCSPSKTLPMPILYEDSNSIDYVVKLLPDMIVHECGCR